MIIFRKLMNKSNRYFFLISELLAYTLSHGNVFFSYVQGRSKNHCALSVFKAAREISSSKKYVDQTGLIMACCRHLIILQAVNMFVGETYRHAHFLHNFLFNAGYRIFCYDIVCLYWKWAEKVGKVMSKYRHLTEKMTAFLSRFHAIAHVWHCYVSIVIKFIHF